jgi:hypothetical protein
VNEYYEKWDELAPRGLALIGFGLSLTGQAITMKTRSKPFWRWFILGTIGLVVVNTGISLFGEAVKNRALYEVELKQQEQKNKP